MLTKLPKQHDKIQIRIMESHPWRTAFFDSFDEYGNALVYFDDPYDLTWAKDFKLIEDEAKQ